MTATASAADGGRRAALAAAGAVGGSRDLCDMREYIHTIIHTHIHTYIHMLGQFAPARVGRLARAARTQAQGTGWG